MLAATAALGTLGAPCASAARPASTDRTDRTDRTNQTDQVAVARVSPEPGAGSGILLFFVEVRGRTGAGERAYLIPYFRRGQPGPQPGQICAIRWHWWRGGGGNGLTGDGTQVWTGRWVDGFRCRG